MVDDEQVVGIPMLEVAVSFLGDNSGLLSPADQLELAGIVLESAEELHDA